MPFVFYCFCFFVLAVLSIASKENMSLIFLKSKHNGQRHLKTNQKPHTFLMFTPTQGSTDITSPKKLKN